MPVTMSSRLSSSMLVAAIRIVLPGAEVPGHRHRARRRSCGRSARSPSASSGPACARRSGRSCSAGGRARWPAAVSSISRTNWPADHVSADAEPAGLPFSKPIDATVGSVPNGERGEVRRLPRLLGDQADAGGHVAHRLQARDGRAGHAAVDLVLAALAGQHRPQVAAALCSTGAHGRPSLSAVAVAVAVVAEEAVAAVGAAADRRVHDRQRADDVRIVARRARRAARTRGSRRR